MWYRWRITAGVTSREKLIGFLGAVLMQLMLLPLWTYPISLPWAIRCSANCLCRWTIWNWAIAACSWPSCMASSIWLMKPRSIRRRCRFWLSWPNTWTLYPSELCWSTVVGRMFSPVQMVQICTDAPILGNHHLMPGWWFGCHQFYFPINIGLRSSSQLTNSYFSEGWPWPTNHLMLGGNSPSFTPTSGCRQRPRQRRKRWRSSRLGLRSRLLVGWWKNHWDP